MNIDTSGLVSWVFSPDLRLVLHLSTPLVDGTVAAIVCDQPEIVSRFNWPLDIDDLTEFARDLRTIHDTRDGTATLTDGWGLARLVMQVADAMTGDLLVSGEFSARVHGDGEVRINLRKLPMSRGQLPLILSDLQIYLAGPKRE